MKFLLFILVCSLSSIILAQDVKTVSIASGEYPPWTSKDYKDQGFVNHVISEAFRRQSYQVSFIYLAWARSIKEAEKGRFHAASYWACSPERKQSFFCSEPLHTEAYVFFHLKTTQFSGWNTLDDLKGYKIGVTRGYTYTKAFWDSHKNKELDLIVNTTDEISMKMLLKGRLNLMIVSSITGLMILNEKFDPVIAQSVTYNSKPLVNNPAHLLFPKSHTDTKLLLTIFNKGLQSMKDDGTFEKHLDMLITGYYKKVAK
ncbi:transporter substrate-binding domain-containing protein [Endozoicomonas sp. SM1973]|uniref:Transporter substrate-binding domain-containing protein n=1 Tax=Spartinivicinus marinus TaxID=2994442 RepID=A0A853IIX9_9GAMM|nr:transporter substrate-binding domain-containing protein [Spartinivicinus marinus]MCX4025182.1 transporter substrate-binding domain-containing protein [Spartinivicinus marinus]NYZ69984.1 transporter substrate-binding domain-containing protein [Spartinivicinus marinus]